MPVKIKKPSVKSPAGKIAPALGRGTPRGPRRAVLHLCADLEPDDPGREVVELAVLTQRSGGRALIASGGGALVTAAERSAVRHTRLPLDGHGMFTAWRNRVRLTALIQRERPSLLHAYGVDLLPLAIGLSRSSHRPLVVNLTEPVADTPRARMLMANLMRVPSLIRVPSEYMFIHLLETFHLPSERIRYIPSGIDMQWHSANSIAPERLQGLSRLWRLPEQATVALVPMPLRPGLGQEGFLEALASIKDENIYAVLIGSDRHAPGYRALLEGEINRLGLNGKIVMPEFCTDWPTAFWLAGVVVAPNGHARGQNRELLAAQAIGRPVIVTDTGANGEMVQSGSTAWVIHPEDPAALAAALREAVHLNTSQRLGLAQQTRDFIAERFPQSAWFKGMMDLYEELVNPPVQRKRTAKAA
jgi:glycosyltransferase involved in cell wall biosynthesis